MLYACNLLNASLKKFINRAATVGLGLGLDLHVKTFIIMTV